MTNPNKISASAVRTQAIRCVVRKKRALKGELYPGVRLLTVVHRWLRIHNRLFWTIKSNWKSERISYEAGTQTAARHDASTRLFRIEEKVRARTRQFKLDPGIRADLDPLRDANVITGRVTFRGGEARFAERGRVHRKRKIASTCAERMRKSVVSG